MIDEIVESIIKTAVKDEVAKSLEPVAVLRQFEGVEQLTLEEMCSLFRREPDEKSKRWLRDACSRGEIPHVKVGEGYYFPKYLVAQFLAGEWKPKERAKVTGMNFSAIARELV